jgi:hypothetical protein
MKKGLLICIPVLFLIIVASGVFIYSKAHSKPAFDPNQFNWQENGKDGYIVKMKSGNISSPIKGKVLNDANCDPDSEGLSHCKVTVALENGKQIEFEMTHNMMNYPCLDLQSTIKLSPYEKGYVKVKK